MKVSYDGTAYNGFQAQAYGRTIQAEIERALRVLTGEEITITSSGRTDAGVHAYGQIFNFYTNSQIELRRWCLALNSILPQDIIILAVIEVPIEFHARKEKSKKTYHYTINNYRFMDVFHRKFQYHHPTGLLVENMQEAITCLIGKHDFTSFCSAKSMKSSHVRTIYEARIELDSLSHRSDQGRILRIVISGDGFLYHMVRIIVGTLIYIGEGKLSTEDMSYILERRDRSLAGPTAAAHGLSLWEVRYDNIVI